MYAAQAAGCAPVVDAYEAGADRHEPLADDEVDTACNVIAIPDPGASHLILEAVRESDGGVVAAGREGALPTVVAGLVDGPVIGRPVWTGYGVGGEGVAALEGALQSCSALTTVNVDAGFVAGAQAGLIARAVDAARAE